MMNLREIFDALKGNWELSRKILPGGIFMGEAQFLHRSVDCYEYCEKGRLKLDNGHLLEDVQKRYLYQFDGNAISVLFDDGPEKGNVFHRLAFSSETQASAEHLCAKDFYVTVYQFELPNQMTIDHEVKGPEKDYIIKSVYSRG